MPSLRLLAKYWLNEDMHAGVHNSVQDAWVALRLYMMHAAVWETAWQSYEYRSTAGRWVLWPPRQLETSIILQEQPMMPQSVPRWATSARSCHRSLQEDAATGPSVSEGSMPTPTTPLLLPVVAPQAATDGGCPQAKAARRTDVKEEANISARIASQNNSSLSGSSKKLGRIWEASHGQQLGRQHTEAAKPVSEPQSPQFAGSKNESFVEAVFKSAPWAKMMPKIIFKPQPGQVDAKMTFKPPPGLEDVLIATTTFNPPPGLEDVLDGSSAVCNTTFKPPPGLEDVLDGSSAVVKLTLEPPPGLADALKHKSEDKSCPSACDVSSQLGAEAVDDQKPITRCILLAIRTACRIDVHSQSVERVLITLMRREQLSQPQHVSSTRDGSADVRDPSVSGFEKTRSSHCKLLPQVGNFVWSEPGLLVELADDLEGSILPCSKQQIEEMDVWLLKGTGVSSIAPRSYLLSMFFAMLLIILGGCIAMALHSSPQDTEGRLRPLALFILRAEVGIRAHFTRTQTQNAPSFLAPMYEQMLPSSPAGPSPLVSSVQIYAGR